jgi:ribulose-phosphate 3-epimerase
MSDVDADVHTARRVAPSILSADFSRLGSQIEEVMDAGARVIHVDVMDGHFVPPITIGPLIVSAIADQVHGAGGALDCHLMIAAPAAQIPEFAAAGADSISFHVEATPHASRLLAAVREQGCRAGLAINPGTPVVAAEQLAADADALLCMSVNPGWGGQRFISSSPAKIERLRALDGSGRIEVDGGVDTGTAPLVAAAGADVLVAGSAIFGRADPAAAYAEIVAAAGAV